MKTRGASIVSSSLGAVPFTRTSAFKHFHDAFFASISFWADISNILVMQPGMFKRDIKLEIYVQISKEHTWSDSTFMLLYTHDVVHAYVNRDDTNIVCVVL